MTYDVIVLGIGAMGAATCYQLAKQGHRVLGLEQYQIGHSRGSSHGETRVIRKAYFEDPNYVPLMHRAYELWAELESDSNEVLFNHCGVVIYGHPQTSPIYKGVVRSASLYNLSIEELAHAQAIARFPAYTPPADYQGVFEPGAGFLHAERAVLAHASQARKFGAEIHEGEAVRHWKSDGSSAVSVTTDLATYSASRLVVAGGSWSAKLVSDLGLPLSLDRMLLMWFEAKSQQASVERGTPVFLVDTGNDVYYGFPMIDGRTVKIASHAVKHRIQDPSEKDLLQIPADKLRDAQDFIDQFLPFVSPKLDHFSTCIYTMTPDEHFIIDVHPQNANVVYACGFSGHGFKFSSVVGEILAELALTGKSHHPIGFLRQRVPATLAGGG
jgi:sarcosine oxidase